MARPSRNTKPQNSYQREIWQRGFSDERIWNRESFLQHRSYIYDNPVRAGLARAPEEYPYGSAYFRSKKKGRA